MSALVVNHDLDGDTKIPEIIAILSVCCVLTTAIVILRLITRSTIVRIVGVDDWIILVSQIGAIGSAVTIGLESTYGLGKHIWVNPASNTIPYLQSFYSSILVYNAALVGVKISILFQYRRIFAGTRMQRATLIALFILGAWGIALVTSLAMICLPIQALWDPNVHGQCMPFLPAFFAPAVINMVTDFGIFILPLPAIKSLQLPLRQKIMLFCIFGLGFFTCIISIVRLSTLDAAATTADPTWDNTEAALWSYLELTIAILAACLPTLRPLMLKIVPKFMGGGSSSSGTKDTSNSNKDPRRRSAYGHITNDIDATKVVSSGGSDSTDALHHQDVEMGLQQLTPMGQSNTGVAHSETMIYAGSDQTSIEKSRQEKPYRGNPGIHAVTVIKQEVRTRP